MAGRKLLLLWMIRRSWQSHRCIDVDERGLGGRTYRCSLEACVVLILNILPCGMVSWAGADAADIIDDELVLGRTDSHAPSEARRRRVCAENEERKSNVCSHGFLQAGG